MFEFGIERFVSMKKFQVSLHLILFGYIEEQMSKQHAFNHQFGSFVVAQQLLAISVSDC